MDWSWMTEGGTMAWKVPDLLQAPPASGQPISSATASNASNAPATAKETKNPKAARRNDGKYQKKDKS